MSYPSRLFPWKTFFTVLGLDMVAGLDIVTGTTFRASAPDSACVMSQQAFRPRVALHH
jgi:hypothetical protein